MLMPYRDQNGNDRADIIDFLTIIPDVRRRVVRVLGEIDAATQFRPGAGRYRAGASV
jgi:hypothetical protein